MRLPVGFQLSGIHSLKGYLNCSDLIEWQYIPTLPEILSEVGPWGVVVLVVACCITIIIALIFLEETIRLYKKWPLQVYCFTLAALAVFPIASLCFLLTILMPRAHDVNTTTATLYQPMSLVLFYKLIVSYYGGEDHLKSAIEGQKVPLKGPPFYYLCHWCPATYMNMKLYYLMKASIYQLFLAPCFLYFVMGVCSKTGVYTSGEFSFENAHIYIMCLGAISFCIGIYALVILYKMASTNMPGYYIRGKYYALQTFFVLTRLHVLVLDTLGNNHLLPCYSPISAFVYGLYLRNGALLVEALILSLVARALFLKKPPSRPLESTCESIAEVDNPNA